MTKEAIVNSLSNNYEHFYFEREYNLIQVLIQDQMISNPCDSALSRYDLQRTVSGYSSSMDHVAGFQWSSFALKA